MSPGLESAIPEGMRRERTCPMAMKSGWTPPYPSYVARFDNSSDHLGMVILGVQGTQEESQRRKIHALCQDVMADTADDDNVLYRDQAEFIDGAEMLNRIIVCYFKEDHDAHACTDRLKQKWFSEGNANNGLGFYVEQIWPSLDRVETLYSSDHVQGVAHIGAELSGEIQEHGYWGSARDNTVNLVCGSRVVVGLVVASCGGGRV